MHRTHVAALLALLAVSIATPASAQDSPEARGKALLDSLGEVDAGLLGTQHFTLCLKTSNMGFASLEVAKGDDTAAYHCTIKFDMTVGPGGQREVEESFLDAKLALVRGNGFEEGNGKKETSTIAIEDGKWVATKDQDGKVSKRSIATEGGNYSDLASALLLARKVDTSAPGTYTFRAIDWPKDPEAEPSWTTVEVKVPARAPFNFRGEDVEACKLSLRNTDGKTMTVIVTPEHALLGFWPDGSPIRLIAAKDADEAKQNLPAAVEPEAPGAAEPKAAVVTYFEVLAKKQPTSALDPIMDWKAVHAQVAAKDPRVGQVSPDMFAEILKDQFSKRPGIPAEQLDLLTASLDVTLEGEDTAKIALPQRPDAPFVLKKRDGGWKIVALP